MTDTRTPEYRAIELDSSNELMDYDAFRATGRYPQAALCALRAGTGRREMGRIMYDVGDYEHAAEDWLSAGECFYLATDLDRMRACVESVRGLADRGVIPADRLDLLGAIPEREQQLQDLEEKLAAFRSEYRTLAGTSADRIEWLRRWVKELPGFPNLHAALVLQAVRSGNHPLAAEHLGWGDTFAPNTAEFRSLRMRLLLAQGQRDAAIALGHDLLTTNPDHRPTRVLLAGAIAFPAGRAPEPADWAEAVKLLGPLTTSGQPEEDTLVPLALAVTFQHGLAEQQEYLRLLGAFNAIAARTNGGIPEALRQAMPEVFPPPTEQHVWPRRGPAFPPLPLTRYEAVQRFAQAA